MRTILLLFLTLAASGCGYDSPKQVTQPGVVPAIAAIMPASQLHGGSDFTLTVTGSNFNGNAVVNWNAAPQTTTHPKANTLSVVIPAAAIATAGTAQVSVTNPGSSTPGGPYGGGSNTPSETSNNVMFTIN
jgi:IPT/TIG domain